MGPTEASPQYTHASIYLIGNTVSSSCPWHGLFCLGSLAEVDVLVVFNPSTVESISEADSRFLSGQLNRGPAALAGPALPVHQEAAWASIPADVSRAEERHVPLLEQVTSWPGKAFPLPPVPCPSPWPPCEGQRGGSPMGEFLCSLLPRRLDRQDGGGSSGTDPRPASEERTGTHTAAHLPTAPADRHPASPGSQPWRKPTCSVLSKSGLPTDQVLYQDMVLF